MGLLIGAGWAAYHDFHQAQLTRLSFAKHDHRPASVVGGLTAAQYQRLAQLNYRPGTIPVVQVNHGRSTLNPKSWRTNKVLYQRLDSRRRTSGSNTAFLQQRNLADTDLRIQQGVQPTGWHSNQDGQLVYNRGHLIAYSLTAGINMQTGKYQPSAVGDQDNVRNLFTESDFTNQMLQTIYEARVRHAIENGKHVVYQATPIFRGNEELARGINLQALSTDGTLNFNIYLYNIEPGISFNYTDGSSSTDTKMKIPVPAEAESNSKNKFTRDNGHLRVTDHYQRPVATTPRHYVRVANKN